MKKTSIKKNNEIKNKFLINLGNLIYQIKKNNLNPHLSEDDWEEIISSLSSLYDDLDTALGTGNEVVDIVANSANDALEAFKQSVYFGLKAEIKESLNLLSNTVDMWVSAIEGEIVADEEERKSSTRKKLEHKLKELDQIIAEFGKTSARIEKDVRVIEEAIEELNEQILNEDNERKLNDLYRQVTMAKTKLDTLNVRKSSYNACYNLLDLIRANAREIVVASDYSYSDLSKAKAFLNITKLRIVLAEPEKALNILKMMNKELEAITNKVKAIDSKILSLNGDSVSINEDALRYKEELMAKKRAKDALQELDHRDVTTVTKGENENEVL